MPLYVEVLDETGEVDGDCVAGSVEAAFLLFDARPAGDWACTVRIAGSDVIAALHGQFFGDPTDTDVMSFPSGEPLNEAGGFLGDIAISIAMARAQSLAAGHSLAREITYLALHGLLHLLGYDDQREPERDVMLSLQDELLLEVERSRNVRL